ncbi:MAG: MerR family transcriptional regulator [Anaerolineaceae bacterium]|nr:MerR family transcriptional regulator [Anaerolineaceae bacterium]
MRIAEVSEKYNISADTLRYYERVGLLPPVNRTDSGIRDFDEGDILRVEFIKCMRSAGLPIEVLTEYIQLVQMGDSTIEQRKQILESEREKLIGRMAEMQKTLDKLDYKISIYENSMLATEQKLSDVEEMVV